MSIDIYKELNKELVEKVQELKKANACLEKEVVYLNSQFQDEYQLRLEERQRYLSLISRLKENISDAELFITRENTDMECKSNTTVSSKGRRSRLSGVTAKSPIRSRNSLGQNDKSSDNLNTWGFSNISERSSGTESACDENTINALNRLTINEDQAESHNEESAINSVPPNLVLSYNKSMESEKTIDSLRSSDGSNLVLSYNKSIESEKTIDSLRSSDGSIGKENFNNSQNMSKSAPSLENLSSLTIGNISSEAFHSTLVNQTGKPVASETLSESTTNNTNNSISNRPRRNCAPTSLIEPKNNTKIRNESGKGLTKKAKKKRK